MRGLLQQSMPLQGLPLLSTDEAPVMNAPPTLGLGGSARRPAAGRCFTAFADMAGAEQATAANKLYITKDSTSSALHGKTDNNETCRCLPGTLETGPSEKELASRKQASTLESAEANYGQFVRSAAKVETQLTPSLKELENQQHLHDEKLLALQESAKKLEDLGTKLGNSFKELETIYFANNCKNLAANAAAHSEEEPKCNTEYKRALEAMKDLGGKAQPVCPDGAVQLLGIRAVTATALPPELVLAAGQLAAAGAAAVGEVKSPRCEARRQRCSGRSRKQRLSLLACHGFL
eukprot:TRINITY_DN83942_c0_g1_i1.p1 TRINITY_DN83942_c0_g1~~TRINITY_DN83942_c0_g1_i1.p1  ORF type:complete len:292 (+),score=83.74 TRINITY_DN83942_c0_g1_i1:55-930(+)